MFLSKLFFMGVGLVVTTIACVGWYHVRCIATRLSSMEEESREGVRKQCHLKNSLEQLGKERDLLSSELEDLRTKLRTSDETVHDLKRQLVESQERHDQLVKDHEAAQKRVEAKDASSLETDESDHHQQQKRRSDTDSPSTLTTNKQGFNNHKSATRRRTQSADRVPQLDIAVEIATRTDEIRREADNANVKLRDQLVKKDNKIKGLKAELRAKQNHLRDSKDLLDKLRATHDSQMRKLSEKKAKSDQLVVELRNRIKNLSKPQRERSQSALAKQKANLEREVGSLKEQLKENEREFRRKFKNWEAERDVLLDKQRNLKKKLRDVARYPPSSASVLPPSPVEAKVPPAPSSIDIESKQYSTRHYDEHSAITKMILEEFAPATREGVDLRKNGGPVSFGDIIGKMNAARIQPGSRNLPIGAVPPGAAGGPNSSLGTSRDVDEESCEFSVDMRGKDLSIWMDNAERKTNGPSRPPFPHRNSKKPPRALVPQDSATALPGRDMMEFGYTPAVFDGNQLDGNWTEPWGPRARSDSQNFPGIVRRGDNGGVAQHGISRSCTPQQIPSLHSCSSECSDKKRKNSSSTEFTTPTPPIPEKASSTIEIGTTAIASVHPVDKNGVVDPWWDSPANVQKDPSASIWAMP